jgi:putative ABC transport system permease protein
MGRPYAPNDEPADRTPAWRRYLRFWRPDATADVADELRFHLESAVAEYVAAGMSRRDAEAEARRRFGDIDGITRTLHTLSHERERTMQRRDWFDAFRQDVKIAVRHLRKSPGFTFVVVLTLALGLGANSAIFSVVHSVLVRPLPYRTPERLVHFREGNGPEAVDGMAVTFGNFGAWVERARSFESFAGWVNGPGLTLTGAGEPQQLRATRATGGYWRALYIPPVLGRYFDEEDARLGAPKVVVLSYGLWQSAFGGDSGIVGRSITLGGEPYVVRGVAAAEYALTPQTASVWVPFALTPEMLADHSDHEMSVVGLVRRGVTNEQAIADLARVQMELKREHPNANFDGRIIAMPFLDFLVGPSSKLLKVLFAAVGLVLLIACVNIANLLLARAAARQKEIAVRGALGAGRGRIIAQLLVESLVLAGLGAIAGLGIAMAGTRFLVRNGPPTLPRLHEASLDGTVVLFTAAVGLVSGIAFGLLPALRASRLDLQSTLRQSGRSDSGAARQSLRSTLVVLQVSVALVLLVGAGLLVRSAILLQRVPPGFDPTNVFAGGLSLPNARYATDTLVIARYDELVSAVAAIPGVASAGIVSRIPIGGFGADCGVRRAGEADGNGGATGSHFRTASGDYFAALGIPLLYGRTFTASDRLGSAPVAIINRRLARNLFGTENAVGRYITSCGLDAPTEVVGIVGDVRAEGLASDVRDQVHYASSQVMQRSMTLVVRAGTPLETLVPAIRRAVNGLDPLLPISTPRTMVEVIDQTLATPRFQSTLLALLGVAGLVLAVVGIYGVIALLVVQRTQEFGIRIALGAQRPQVLTMVVRQGLTMAFVGIVVGVAASLVATRLLDDMLFGVGPRDPLTFGVVAGLIAVAAVAASAIPAWRAMRVDPLVAMRS